MVTGNASCMHFALFFLNFPKHPRICLFSLNLPAATFEVEIKLLQKTSSEGTAEKPPLSLGVEKWKQLRRS